MDLLIKWQKLGKGLRKMKCNWLSRDLIISPVYYTLCTTQRMFETELKSRKIEPFDGINSGSDATTHFIESNEGHKAALVCLFDHKHTKEQIFALLVHEAIHIWQEIRRAMDEKSPSDEFEAYSVQRLTQNLFYEYKRQTKKR